MWNFFRRTSQPWAYEEMEAQFVSPDRQESFTTSVPSALAGASFTAAVTLRWRGGDAQDGARVRHLVQRYMNQRAAEYSVTALDQLADRLNSWGTTARPVPGTDLVITYLYVRLTTSADALAAAVSWQELQRQAALDDLRRQQELRRLRWLRDEVFGQPDIARMYWHVNHPDDLGSLGAPSFEEIAARLTTGGVAAAQRSEDTPVGTLVGEFVHGLDADERRHLISQLDRVFRSFDRPDLADRLPAGETPAEKKSP